MDRGEWIEGWERKLQQGPPKAWHRWRAQSLPARTSGMLLPWPGTALSSCCVGCKLVAALDVCCRCCSASFSKKRSVPTNCSKR